MGLGKRVEFVDEHEDREAAVVSLLVSWCFVFGVLLSIGPCRLSSPLSLILNEDGLELESRFSESRMLFFGG